MEYGLMQILCCSAVPPETVKKQNELRHVLMGFSFCLQKSKQRERRIWGEAK